MVCSKLFLVNWRRRWPREKVAVLFGGHDDDDDEDKMTMTLAATQTDTNSGNFWCKQILKRVSVGGGSMEQQQRTTFFVGVVS